MTKTMTVYHQSLACPVAILWTLGLASQLPFLASVSQDFISVNKRERPPQPSLFFLMEFKIPTSPGQNL